LEPAIVKLFWFFLHSSAFSRWHFFILVFVQPLRSRKEQLSTIFWTMAYTIMLVYESGRRIIFPRCRYLPQSLHFKRTGSMNHCQVSLDSGFSYQSSHLQARAPWPSWL